MFFTCTACSRNQRPSPCFRSNQSMARPSLVKTCLRFHDDVDAIWCFADEASAAAAKSVSVGNLKQVFTNEGSAIDWFDLKQGEGRWFLEHAVQVKNIWVPYGE